MQDAKTLALKHSATSFLNALFLEWHDYLIVEKNGKKNITFSLSTELSITIPLLRHSLLGRHHYTGQFFVEENGKQSEISFLKLAKEISQYFAHMFGTSQANLENFYSRLENSIKNIEMTITGRQDHLRHLFSKHLNFKDAEQGLFVGHSFHPTPKSRGEFKEEDYVTYSAELGGKFPLEWILIKKELFFEKASEKFNDKNWMNRLFKSEFQEERKRHEDYLPFPLHSWQKKYLFDHKDIQSYLEDGRILEIGPSDKMWYPTSSLRTLYAPHSEFMIKFSLNVRLTNSVRNLLVHELERGLQIHEAFNHPQGIEFQNSQPEFSVIHEPVYAGILDKKGLPVQESLIVIRENPFKEDSQAVVVATLTQDHPSFEKNLLHQYIEDYAKETGTDFSLASKKWFEAFLNVSLKPLVMAQANYGILLGSHQQNMILEIKNNLPVKSFFRDCNGTGYTKLGQKTFSNIQRINEADNIFDEEPSKYLLGYYVVINSTFNVLSSIAHSGWIAESDLISSLRNFLFELKRGNLKDESFVDYLLNSPTLMHKGNFLCCLKDINENTTANPLSIYTQIKNPIVSRNSI